MLAEGTCGDCRVLASQPVKDAISIIILGVIAPGLLNSKITSPVASSQKAADRETPFGTSFKTVDLVNSSEILMLGSVRITNLFFSVLESPERYNVSSVSANLGFFVYSAIFGPSNRAAVIDASFGSCEVNESYRDSSPDSLVCSVVLIRFLSDIFVEFWEVLSISEVP